MSKRLVLYGVFFLFGISAAANAAGTMAPPATVGPQTLSGFGGSAGAHEFFLQDGSSWKGDLTGIGAGTTWSLVVLGIDASGVTGSADRYIYFNLQDADDGSHFKNIGINFYLDATGAGGGTLFQCYQDWSNDGLSSHGLNSGELTDTHFDLRFDFVKAAFADGWTMTPSFRLDGGVWTEFFDGPFTASVGSIDFDAGKLIVGFDGGADGAVSFDNYYLAGPASNTYVDDDWTGYEDGTPVQYAGEGAYHTCGVDAFSTIPDGIDNVSGSTVFVADGAYSSALNIDGRSGITIWGQSRAGTIYQPDGVNFWLIPGYPEYNTRRAGIRVYNSTDIEFRQMTMDFDLIKGNNVAGVLYWDATGGLYDNEIRNMSVPDANNGYYEITTYFRSPGYSDNSRAPVEIVGNTFLRTGRLAITSHDFVDILVDGNTFDKGGADFGYAMELGSASSATVTGNTIYGFDTPAASDGSASAGIYIENSFTQALTGITKTVHLEGNEIYDCQNGLFIGNQVNNYAGDVDIVLTMTGNNIHDNAQTGVTVVDEDRENGSSVTVTSTGNTIINNGSTGVLIGSEGDGDITVNMTGETITGNNDGVGLWDDQGVSSGSVYDVTVGQSTIMGNSALGIENIHPQTTITATHNYWGTITGPHHATANPGGTGNGVSDYVEFMPWCNEDFSYCEYPVMCGNANGDGSLNVSDAVYIVAYVFQGGPAPDPLCIGNANGDDSINISDAVYMVNYVFKGGPPPVIDCCP